MQTGVKRLTTTLCWPQQEGEAAEFRNVLFTLSSGDKRDEFFSQIESISKQ
jgi:hypothetical protein